MRVGRRLLAGALATVTLATSAACGGEGPDAEAPAGGDAAPADSPLGADTIEGPPPAPDRPTRRTDTVSVEGMPEEMALRLYRTPAGVEPGFSAYVPGDMAAVTRERERGWEVRFVTEFAGTRNPDAYLSVVLHPPGTTEAEAREAARASAVERGYQGGETAGIRQRWRWAAGGYPLGRELSGAAAWGRHGGHLFQVVLQYPPEYGDGMAPRVGMILDTWIWHDGGPLQPR